MLLHPYAGGDLDGTGCQCLLSLSGLRADPGHGDLWNHRVPLLAALALIHHSLTKEGVLSRVVDPCVSEHTVESV